MLLISRSSPPTCENVPNFGFTCKQAQQFRKLSVTLRRAKKASKKEKILPRVRAYRSSNNWAHSLIAHDEFVLVKILNICDKKRVNKQRTRMLQSEKSNNNDHKQAIVSHVLTNSRTISIIHVVIILTQFVTCLPPTAVLMNLKTPDRLVIRY